MIYNNIQSLIYNMAYLSIYSGLFSSTPFHSFQQTNLAYFVQCILKYVIFLDVANSYILNPNSQLVIINGNIICFCMLMTYFPALLNPHIYQGDFFFSEIMKSFANKHHHCFFVSNLSSFFSLHYCVGRISRSTLRADILALIPILWVKHSS